MVLDLRNEEIIHPTNRFMIYALFPQCNISMHMLWGLKQQNTVFATGKSILDRSSRTNIGELMLSYGGGGHDAAGTCQVSNTRAPKVLGELIERINADELVEEDEPGRAAAPRSARAPLGAPGAGASPAVLDVEQLLLGLVIHLQRRVVDPEAVVQELLELAPAAVAVVARRARARARPAPGSRR